MDRERVCVTAVRPVLLLVTVDECVREPFSSGVFISLL